MHMCEATDKGYCSQVCLCIVETEIVWVSKKEKVWQHQSCFQNRLTSVFPKKEERIHRLFWKIQCPMWAFRSPHGSNLKSIVGKCSTNEATS
ncbi:hypothetical protein TNCV_4405461 [Trichonephila clavipes]|uniref:Uncharacterized protein n=1 Tax=Trichonephila clavipes TaxID=2585209 RepID=A0A8X6S744_TRICX|nr:hypothetical protein TNCV_4405461 [Trichonephila clavipes]